jgi:hypothetical protein
MYFLRFLTAFAVIQFVCASTGQGIEPSHSEKPSSKAVEESVKQEVFLKTANAEPIEIHRVKRFESQGLGNSNEPVQSLRRTQELDEITVAPKVGYVTQKSYGIGHGTSGTSVIGTGTGYGSGYHAEIGTGTRRDESIGRGADTVAGTPGIGSGTGYGGYNPGSGHGIKVGGKPPAIGSGAVDDIVEVGIGHGTYTTRRTPSIGQGVEVEFGIGSGTDSKGDRVVLDSDVDGVNTALGDEVKIGGGVRPSRLRRNSQFDRFDTGFAKECNSYYGKIICYRVYTNPSISTPSEYTCWRISNGRKNCTEIDNIVYLKDRGFQPDEYEVRQHPRPRPTLRPEEDVIIRGQDRYYDPYNPAPRRHGTSGITPGENTHRFVTSTLKLGRDNSLEFDNGRELYRQKRKRA